MNDWRERSRLLLGNKNIGRLEAAHVLIVGLGGVGAYAAENIGRAGVGTITLVDGDVVSESNRNRQLPALVSTTGKSKAKVVAQRLRDINPNLQLHIINEYIKDERMIEILQQPFDYVIDAIDTLAPKIYLIYHSLNRKLPIVSSMGAGAKLDPTQIKITDISKTYNCKLARILRKRLHKLGVYSGVKAVFSPEKVIESAIEILPEGSEANKRSNTGTISYMPAAFGLACASVVIRDLTQM